MAKKPERVFVTNPHAAQEVFLVDDDPDFDGKSAPYEDRIYVIRDPLNAKAELRRDEPSSKAPASLGILGSELDSLAKWWTKERGGVSLLENYIGAVSELERLEWEDEVELSDRGGDYESWVCDYEDTMEAVEESHKALSPFIDIERPTFSCRDDVIEWRKKHAREEEGDNDDANDPDHE